MGIESSNIQSELNKRLEAQLRLKRFFSKLLSEAVSLEIDQIIFRLEDVLAVELYKGDSLEKSIKIKPEWYGSIRDWLRQRWVAVSTECSYDTRSAKDLSTFAVRIRHQVSVVQANVKISQQQIQLLDLVRNPLQNVLKEIHRENAQVADQLLRTYSQDIGVIIVAAPKRIELTRSVANTLGLTIGYYGGELEDFTVRKIASHLAKKELIVLSSVSESLPSLLNSLKDKEMSDIRKVLVGCTVNTFIPRVCGSCATGASLPKQLAAALPDQYAHVAQYRESSGCPACQKKGYRNWVLLQQGIAFSPALQDLYKENPAQLLLEQYVKGFGYQSFSEQAAVKAARGELTVEAIRSCGYLNPASASNSSEIVDPILLDEDFFIFEEESTVAVPLREGKAFTPGAMPHLIKKEDESLFSKKSIRPKKSVFDVLLVEDDVDQRNILELVLSEAGYVVSTAENGADALKKLNDAKPDLVIADIMMPEMNGEEMIARMKSSAELKSIPILVLTVLSDTDREYALLDLGVDEYCEKTIQRKLLLKRIENLMRRFYGE